MAYVFETQKAAKFQFSANAGENQMSLAGINATVSSADTICDGIDSLMSIGSNQPVYATEAKRTVIQVVNNAD